MNQAISAPLRFNHSVSLNARTAHVFLKVKADCVQQSEHKTTQGEGQGVPELNVSISNESKSFP